MHRRVVGAFVAGVAGGMALIHPLPLAAAETQTGPLKIVGQAKHVLDPICNARNGVSFEVRLLNSSAKPVELALTWGGLTGDTASRTSDAKVTITVPETAKGSKSGRVSIARGEIVALQVRLNGFLEDGEWKLELQSAGAPLGTVAVVAPPSPLSISLDAANAQSPDVSFLQGHKTRLLLKNDDPVPHVVSGEFSLKGIAATSASVTLVASLSSVLWQQDPMLALQVFNAEVDDSGFDVVLGVGSERRYVQLKQAHSGKLPPDCSVRLSFASVPGACVVLMSYEQRDLSISSFRFLGGLPSVGLPDIESLRMPHAPGRRLATGERKVRENYRKVPLKLFTKAPDAQCLASLLFPSTVASNTSFKWTPDGAA